LGIISNKSANGFGSPLPFDPDCRVQRHLYRHLGTFTFSTSAVLLIWFSAMEQRSHLFPAALASVMQDCDVNQVRLSELTGIAVSRINNYLHGNYRTIKPAHLAAISKALSEKPADVAALAQAYLFDLLPDDCRGRVEIKATGARETGKWEVPSKGLPKEFATAFQDLYVLCASDAQARQRTAQWIALMRDTIG
jgi:Cro/C1-type HTH DNA-binding domain